jgi:hypothetical protein
MKKNEVVIGVAFELTNNASPITTGLIGWQPT